MIKTHAIVHSRFEPLSLPIQIDDDSKTSSSNWYVNRSVWMNLFLMAASASAIGTTVAIAVYKFPPIELQNNSIIPNNGTMYKTKSLNTSDIPVTLQFDPLSCNTTTDDALLAQIHLTCGQSRSSIFLIKYSNKILIDNGQNYPLEQIKFHPKISFNSDEFKRLSSNEIQQTYFIIIMFDVDDSINSPIQYWILTMNEKTNNHKDICSYKTPNVYTPPHRYVFLLYTTSLKTLELSNNLCNNQSYKFPLNKIIIDNQLKLLASFYFLSEKNMIPTYIDEK